MCRLLLIKSEKDFFIESYLKSFSEIAKNSKEYQGHGWGFAYLEKGSWKIYRNIKPVWEEDFSKFSEIKTKELLAHARSAFRDEGIVVENNMPFQEKERIFIFNGQLKGVKISEEGRIGAEKIFNFINRFDKGNLFEAVEKAVEIIKKRTAYIKAMNFIISDKEKVYLVSFFNEDESYFRMHKKEGEVLIICSEPLSEISGWEKIENNTIQELK